ncbi:MAG: NFACT RNA binding domain-containing protein [Candidatus Woesearchaeota archaeon]
MELKLSINKSIEQNAEKYFDQAKKYKKKIPGIKKTIDMYNEKLIKAEENINSKKQEQRVEHRKKEWFEKFRWFISSDDMLVIGGRDATTNDIIIKKYTDKNDLVFHTELAGSPFVIIKNTENKKIPDQTIKEAAEFCASFSKSWKSGRTTAELYHITPEQVTKEAPAGMAALAKGSFMINGKRNLHNAVLNLAICNIGRIMTGPVSAIKKQCEDKNIKYLEIVQGETKLSDVAKKVQKIIGGELDEIIRSLPSECMIKK